MQVDGGVGLAAIVRLLEGHKQSRSTKNGKNGESSRDGAKSPVTLIDGPFEGLQLPHVSPEANARYIYQELINTVLFTHPHSEYPKFLRLHHIRSFISFAVLPSMFAS